MLVFGGDAMGIPAHDEVMRHMYLNDMWGLMEAKRRNALLWTSVGGHNGTNGTDGGFQSLVSPLVAQLPFFTPLPPLHPFSSNFPSCFPCFL